MKKYVLEIKNKGLKVTGPRLKILELFEHHPEGHHMSADDVYKIILEGNLDIGIATVYRVLTQFQQAGILTKHNFDTGKAVYELNRGNHDHILCIKCGRITEFKDEEMEDLQKIIAKRYGYKILDHSLYMYGICQDQECLKKDNK